MGGAFVDWRGRVVVVLGYVGGEVSFLPFLFVNVCCFRHQVIVICFGSCIYGGSNFLHFFYLVKVASEHG